MGTHDVDGTEIDQLVRGLTEPLMRVTEPEVVERPSGHALDERAFANAGRTRRQPARARRDLDRRPPPVTARVHAFIRMPDAVMVVRFWVGLGAFYLISMTFWPYPKTYWWGLDAYLLSLAIMLVSGIWGARLAWDARLGASQTVALGSVVLGARSCCDGLAVDLTGVCAGLLARGMLPVADVRHHLSVPRRVATPNLAGTRRWSRSEGRRRGSPRPSEDTPGTGRSTRAVSPWWSHPRRIASSPACRSAGRRWAT